MTYFRWNRQKGEAVSPTNVYWFPKEPNIKEFDYSTRKICPITRKAYEKCSSNPSYACSISDDFQCDQEPDKFTSINPNLQ